MEDWLIAAHTTQRSIESSRDSALTDEEATTARAELKRLAGKDGMEKYMRENDIEMIIVTMVMTRFDVVADVPSCFKIMKNIIRILKLVWIEFINYRNEIIASIPGTTFNAFPIIVPDSVTTTTAIFFGFVTISQCWTSFWDVILFLTGWIPIWRAWINANEIWLSNYNH